MALLIDYRYDISVPCIRRDGLERKADGITYETTRNHGPAKPPDDDDAPV